MKSICNTLPDKELLRVDEVAEYFGVSRKTIYNWVDMGKLQGCNPNGGSLRIFRQSVVVLIRESIR
jgi:excisionase family DNA binding protein